METIFNSQYAKATDLQTQAQKAIPFLIKFKPEITVGSIGLNIIAAARTLSSTPLTDIFNRIVLDRKLDKIYFMNFSDIQTVSIPEILLMEQIVIDGEALKQCPDYLKKPWVNITPYVFKKQLRTEEIRISDSMRLFNTVVLATLCKSYDVSNGWLSPTIASIVIKMYSNIISLLLQITFNLDFQDFRLVQTLFAAYYAKMLGRESNDKVPYLLNRCAFLGTLSEINGRLDLFHDEYKELTLLNICSFLKTSGPPRMKFFGLPILFKMFAMSASDNQTMLLALTYPPYFVYVLLKNVSGFKNPTITNTIKKTGFKKDMDALTASLKITNF